MGKLIEELPELKKIGPKERKANQEMARLGREGKRGTKQYLQAWRRAVEAGLKGE